MYMGWLRNDQTRHSSLVHAHAITDRVSPIRSTPTAMNRNVSSVPKGLMWGTKARAVALAMEVGAEAPEYNATCPCETKAELTARIQADSR